MIQTLNRRLGLMRIDKNNPQSKLALVVAEILKTLQITPKEITKISQIEAHMGRKPNIPLSSLATNSSPNNLSRENAEHSCLDQKTSTQPPLPAEVKHDLHSWSEDKIAVKRRSVQPPGPNRWKQKCPQANNHKHHV